MKSAPNAQRRMLIIQDIFISLALLLCYAEVSYVIAFILPLEDLYKWLSFFLLTALFSNLTARFCARLPARYSRFHEKD